LIILFVKIALTVTAQIAGQKGKVWGLKGGEQAAGAKRKMSK